MKHSKYTRYRHDIDKLKVLKYGYNYYLNNLYKLICAGTARRAAGYGNCRNATMSKSANGTMARSKARREVASLPAGYSLES